jgi:hypothetical protein
LQFTSFHSSIDFLVSVRDLAAMMKFAGTFVKSISSHIKTWYNGKFVSYQNDADSDLIFIVGGYHKRHWSAIVARCFVAFYLRHWKWIWSSIIAALALL